MKTADPWQESLKKRWMPFEMLHAPRLDADAAAAPVEPRYCLMINPFYAKDPHASFGKHVLTPSLALTSFAATTPADWRLQYWDENLLPGPPPCRPMPEVVGHYGASHICAAGFRTG